MLKSWSSTFEFWGRGTAVPVLNFSGTHRSYFYALRGVPVSRVPKYHFYTMTQLINL